MGVIRCVAINHGRFHLDVESVASPVSHVVQELVTLYDDVWILGCIVSGVSEIRVLDVDHSSSCANILGKYVIDEQYRSLISFYKKGRDCFYIVDN